VALFPGEAAFPISLAAEVFGAFRSPLSTAPTTSHPFIVNCSIEQKIVGRMLLRLQTELLLSRETGSILSTMVVYSRQLPAPLQHPCSV
jgi:hypothetical protein